MCKDNAHLEDVKAACAAGFRIQFNSHGNVWKDYPNKSYAFACQPKDYRVHPEEVSSWEKYKAQKACNNKPHVHAELIKAWADGANIQSRYCEGNWVDDTLSPYWFSDCEYRIKPVQTDLEKYGVEVGDVWRTGSGVWLIAAFSGTESFRTLQGYLVTKLNLQQLRFRRGVVNKL